MTRIFTTGFETGNTTDISSGWRHSVTAGSARTGGYGLNLGDGGNALFLGWTGVSDIFIGAACAWADYATTGSLCHLIDNNAVRIATLKIAANGHIAYYVGDGSGSPVATGTFTVQTMAFFYIEIHYTVADSSGIFKVKINGAVDCDYTGDTKPSTGTTVCNFEPRGAGGPVAATYWDDIVVNDTNGSVNNMWPGAVKLDPIRPNADGDVEQLLIYGGADSYAVVDEVPTSVSDYLYETTVDKYTLLQMGTVTIPSGAVVKNLIGITSAYMDSGSGQLALMVKTNGSENTGDTQTLGISLRNYAQVWNTNPITTSGWTQDDIDNLQVGVKIK